MTAVQLQKIEHAYGRKPVLRGVDLDVKQGEYLVLLGQSGGGKTTLLQAIAGLIRPNAGKISFAGEPIDHLPPRRRDVAYVFQQDTLYPHLSVRDSIRFSLRSRGDFGAVSTQIARAASMTGIDDLLDRFPDGLSGGERRRCAVAKAIASGRSLRLLDEPLAALDAPQRWTLQGELARWHRLVGGTTIHVTHDGQEAMRLADRIAVLDQGQIVQCDSAEVLFARPETVGVARAIGMWPMQWLSGTIQNKELRVDLDRASHPVPFDSGDGRVEIGYRPEEVRVEVIPVDSKQSDHRSGSSLQLQGVTLQHRQLTHQAELHFECEEKPLLAVTDQALTNRPLPAGTEVRITIPRDAMHVFRADNGQRI